MKILRLFRSPMKAGRNEAKKIINLCEEVIPDVSHKVYQNHIEKEEKDVIRALTGKDGLTIERHDYSVGYLEVLKKALARKKKQMRHTCHAETVEVFRPKNQTIFLRKPFDFWVGLN